MPLLFTLRGLRTFRICRSIVPCRTFETSFASKSTWQSEISCQHQKSFSSKCARFDYYEYQQAIPSVAIETKPEVRAWTTIPPKVAMEYQCTLQQRLFCVKCCLIAYLSLHCFDWCILLFLISQWTQVYMPMYLFYLPFALMKVGSRPTTGCNVEFKVICLHDLPAQLLKKTHRFHISWIYSKCNCSELFSVEHI